MPDRYNRARHANQAAAGANPQETWGMGPADEDDERYHLAHQYWGPYGRPTAPRPYQRGEGAPPPPRGREAMGSRVAPAAPGGPGGQYHYPYYGFGYTGYGQFGGGYGTETRHLLYEAGPYAGIGPDGYTKSDEHIREEINDALTQDSWLDPTDVKVGVEHGDVTLTGTVDSRFARRRAGEDAWAIPGVTHVHNNLRITAQEQPEEASM